MDDRMMRQLLGGVAAVLTYAGLRAVTATVAGAEYSFLGDLTVAVPAVVAVGMYIAAQRADLS